MHGGDQGFDPLGSTLGETAPNALRVRLPQPLRAWRLNDVHSLLEKHGLFDEPESLGGVQLVSVLFSRLRGVPAPVGFGVHADHANATGAVGLDERVDLPVGEA